jgi:hypothetical protein
LFARHIRLSPPFLSRYTVISQGLLGHKKRGLRSSL